MSCELIPMVIVQMKCLALIGREKYFKMFSEILIFLLQNFGGSKSLNPSRRPPQCPSMHTSQIKLTRPLDGPEDWNTHYGGTFTEKPIIPVSLIDNEDNLLEMSNPAF